MNQANVETQIATFANEWADQNLVGWEWRKVVAYGRGEIEIKAKGKNANAETLILGLIVEHKKRHVYVTNIMMPQNMKHRGLGKALIASIRSISEEAGYAIFATGLVPGFYKRLVKRGAIVVIEDDAVMITAETDLSHHHG